MDIDTEQLFDKLHKNIMDRAEEWVKAKSLHDLHQGMLMGAVYAWFTVAALYNLEGYLVAYEEYRALWYAPMGS